MSTRAISASMSLSRTTSRLTARKSSWRTSSQRHGSSGARTADSPTRTTRGGYLQRPVWPLPQPGHRILSGTFAQLVATMDERPAVGLAGVKQSPPTAAVPNYPPFPERHEGARRSTRLREMAGSAPVGRRRDSIRAGTTRSSRSTGRRARSCSPAVRRYSAGLLDERSFIYTEEPDLCLRMRNAGWKSRTSRR